jgi:hypothetical protein
LIYRSLDPNPDHDKKKSSRVIAIFLISDHKAAAMTPALVELVANQFREINCRPITLFILPNRSMNVAEN